LAAVILVVFVGWWGAMPVHREGGSLVADWFQVRDVTVTGASRVSYEDVLERLGLQSGETLFSVNATELADRLKSHPWIKEAIVNRELFHTLAVTITERRPAAVLRTPSLNLLLDEEGRVLSTLGEEDDPALPVLVGIDPKRLIQGEAQSRQVARAGIELARLVSQAVEGRLQVNAGNPDNLVASVQGLRFQFGPASFEEKWDRYQRLQPTIRARADSGESQFRSEIDLRYPGKVIVRERG
jgi:cell division protein FtsQ